jgi:hypothetical protein
MPGPLGGVVDYLGYRVFVQESVPGVSFLDS